MSKTTNKKTSNIKKDLVVGGHGEELVKNIFKLHKFQVEEPLDRSHDFRILFPPELQVEVKNDLYSQRSGNIALEVFNTKQNKASGVLASKTHVWCHIHYKDNAPLISFCITSDLLEYCNNIKPFRIIDSGGDNNSKMMLYKQDDFMDYFWTIEHKNLLIFSEENQALLRTLLCAAT
jgi:hypothetical protein